MQQHFKLHEYNGIGDWRVTLIDRPDNEYSIMTWLIDLILFLELLECLFTDQIYRFNYGCFTVAYYVIILLFVFMYLFILVSNSERIYIFYLSYPVHPCLLICFIVLELFSLHCVFSQTS